MNKQTYRYAILHRGRAVAWFARRKDATEMLSNMEWSAGPGVYSLATGAGAVLPSTVDAARKRV